MRAKRMVGLDDLLKENNLQNILLLVKR